MDFLCHEKRKKKWKARHLGVVWFKKCNANGNSNGFDLITGGNKFEQAGINFQCGI